MNFTPELCKRIAAACSKACGPLRKVDVAERVWTSSQTGQSIHSVNLFHVGYDKESTNVYDIIGLDTIGSVQPGILGWVALDCYCYEPEAELVLDTNVYVLIDVDRQIALTTPYTSVLDAVCNRLQLANLWGLSPHTYPLIYQWVLGDVPDGVLADWLEENQLLDEELIMYVRNPELLG